MNWIELVQETAKEFDIKLTSSEADYILWEETGFPAFFDGDPETCCREQLRKFFREEYFHF